MNEKEIGELRRRITPDKTSIQRIRGCYVTEQREILSTFNSTLAMLNEIETEELLAIIKKTLSGTLGKNLIDLEFSTNQVLTGEEHKLLSELRSSSIENDEAVDSLYKKIIDSVHIEGSYLILLASDKYDVFSYSGDGSKDEDSATVFSYFLCSICPIKLTKPALSYYGDEFHSVAANSVIANPEIGFMFPAFDDRAANIYHALYYTKDLSSSSPEFVARIFGKEAPMPAKVQKATFNDCISEALGKECSLEIVKSVSRQVAEMEEAHKELKIPEPLTLTKSSVKGMLEKCGVDEKAIESVGERMDESYGKNAELRPKNIVTTSRLEVVLPDIKISVKKGKENMISTQVINGKKYVLIDASEGVEVNGIRVKIEE